jgi:WD40 repeat protein
VQGRRGPVYAVAWSIDGKLLAGTSHVKWVRLWDVGSGKELKRLRNSSSAHWITAVAWSFDGKFLASGGTHCRIILWDAKKGERLTKLKGFYHPVFCLQFNPTDAGQLIIGSWDNTVELWSVADGQCQQTLTGHSGNSGKLDAVAWSIDGKVASGSTDKTVMIWNSSTGERLKTLEGHSNSVSCLQFNPTGAGQLVTGSGDKTVKVWSVADGQCQQTLTGHGMDNKDCTCEFESGGAL